MVKALKKLKKLRGRSFDELRVRGAQALAAQAERRGWSSLARVPDDAALFKMLDAPRMEDDPVTTESLLEHFRQRASPVFFVSFKDQDETAAAWRRRFGAQAEAALLERARRIVDGRFDLLGLRDLYFGEPVDWHLEPLSGKRAPLIHWSRINYLDAEISGDKKITWELNRHQYFATLGQAYWLTHHELYAQAFIRHIIGWMDQNPPKLGINWASSLEVAFRSISWLWALYFFRDSTHLTPPLLSRILKLLYLHARHLETYLSTYFSPNTHLTGEALGLFYLGTLLPEFRRATHWRALGRSVLLAELHRHVRADGVYFEQSSYYHRYTTDFYTHFLILSRVNDEPVGSEVEEKLRALLDHLMYITRPDGTTPLFGDDDGGRLLMMDVRAGNDFRAALSTGAALFARPDYKSVAGPAAEETFWLLGEKGLDAFDSLEARPPAHTSRAFADGGYYVMRDGWTSESNYLLMDCGPHGALNYGHAHADALSFELAARGRTLLVDPGTYTYTGSAELRDYFRGASAHNTLTIDGESSSVPAGPFSWKHVARASALKWISRERFDYFEGTHDAYERLQAPATHTRSLLFLKDDYWIMRDRVASAGSHRYDLHFHFAADADPVVDCDESVAAVREQEGREHPGVELLAFAQGGRWRKEQSWISECYRERAPAPVLTFSFEAEGAQQVFTFLIPRRAQEESARVYEIEAIGGRAFAVRGGDQRDILVVSDGGRAETAQIVSDCAWAWVRMGQETASIEELILVGGRYLSVNNREIFRSSEYIGYWVARRVGDELRVEADAGRNLAMAPLGAERVILNGRAFDVRGGVILNLDEWSHSDSTNPEQKTFA